MAQTLLHMVPSSYHSANSSATPQRCCEPDRLTQHACCSHNAQEQMPHICGKHSLVNGFAKRNRCPQGAAQQHLTQLPALTGRQPPQVTAHTAEQTAELLPCNSLTPTKTNCCSSPAQQQERQQKQRQHHGAGKLHTITCFDRRPVSAGDHVHSRRNS